MKLKKNKVSNLIWIIYSIFALAFSALVFTKFSESIGYDAGFGLVAVPIVFGLGIGVVFLYEFIRSKTSKTITVNSIVSKLLPYCIALCLLGTGIWLRVREFGRGDYILGDYYANSVITSSPMIKTLHGASQFYYFFLRNIFMLFGNHYEAAIIFQIVCQIVGFITLFFGIKRIMGNIPALTMIAFETLAPFSVSQCMELGPSSMYLMFIGIDILIISYVVPFRKASYIVAAIAGAFTGIIGYMDLISVIFAMFAVLFLIVDDFDFDTEKKTEKINTVKSNKTVKNKKGKKKTSELSFFKADVYKVELLQKKTIALIIFFGAWLFLLFICVVIDLAATGFPFSYVVRTQLALYKPGTFSLYSLFSGVDIISGSILAILMIVGVMAGFRRRNTDQGCFVFIISIVLILLSGFSMIKSDMNCYYYILLLFSLLAGETISDFALINNTKPNKVEVLSEEEALIQEAERLKAKNKTVHKIEDGEMLDNPLPVPEKKKRKKMEYDYFVPDDAEYDI